MLDSKIWTILHTQERNNINGFFDKYLAKNEDMIHHLILCMPIIDMMIKNGKQVGMYPIGEDSFLDMGEFSEMKRMEERILAKIIVF